MAKLKASRDIQFHQGLSTTLARRLLGPGQLAECWNATGERGQAEARPGFAIIQKLIGSDGDIFGMGYGRYDNTEEYVVIGKPATDTLASVYVLGVNDGEWPYDVETYGDNLTAVGNWQFSQFGEHIYAVNNSAGLYRRRIGSTSGVETWQKVNTQFRYDVQSDIDTDELVTRRWNNALDVPSIYAVGTYSANDASLIDAEDGVFRIDQTSDWQGSLAQHVDSHSFFVAAISDNGIATAGTATGVSFIASRYVSLSFTFTKLDTDGNEVPPGSSDNFGPSVANPSMCYVSTVASASMPTGTPIGIAPYITQPYRNTWPSPWFKVPMKEVQLSPHNIVWTLDFDRLARETGIDITQIRKIACGFWIHSRVRFRVTCAPMQLGGVFLNKPTRDSFMVDDPEGTYTGQLKEMEYAVQYFNSTTTIESSGVIVNLGIQHGYGVPVTTGATLPVGNRAKVTLTEGTGANAPANFDKIRVWRRRHADSDKWYLISTATNADGYYVDALVDALDDIATWPTTLIRDSTHEFTGGVDQSLLASAVWAWKGHLCLGVEREVYMSYGGTPNLFVPPLRDNPQFFDSDDPTMGRTLYMAQDQSDTVLGGIADDFQYLMGRRGVYAMVGDSALTASPPRLLPGSKGTFGYRSYCKFAGGVLAANEEGLYHHRAARALAAGSDSVYEFENLTADIERTWKLFTSDPEERQYMVVREWQNEIYCIIANRFLKRNRRGKWEQGAWVPAAVAGEPYTGTGGSGTDPGTGFPWGDDPGIGTPFPVGPFQDPNVLPATVIENPIHGIQERWQLGITPTQIDYWPGFDSVSWNAGEQLGRDPLLGSTLYDPPEHLIMEAFGVEGRGFRAISRNGTFMQVSYTENGVAYANDAGYPIAWLMMTGDIEFEHPYRFGLGNIFINSYSRNTGDDEGEPIRVVLTSLDGKSGFSQQYWDVPSRTFQMGKLNIKPGSRWSVMIAGRSAAAICERLVLEFESAETFGK